VTSDVAALVRAAQDGDTIAMNDLLDHIAAYVGRICGPIALDSGADAVQESLVAVFRSLRSLRQPEALYGWVRAIAVREAIRVARRDRQAMPHELIDLPAPGEPQFAVDVHDTLARLSPEHRAVLVLRDLEGLDERTTAALLALPAGTAKSRLHRARENFRKAWTS
jgi:RNA polymerase sigma factor (sigma-70 family)